MAITNTPKNNLADNGKNPGKNPDNADKQENCVICMGAPPKNKKNDPKEKSSKDTNKNCHI